MKHNTYIIRLESRLFFSFGHDVLSEGYHKSVDEILDRAVYKLRELVQGGSHDDLRKCLRIYSHRPMLGDEMKDKRFKYSLKYAGHVEAKDVDDAKSKMSDEIAVLTMHGNPFEVDIEEVEE